MKINKKATLVNSYRPQIDTFSKALGSYDCLGDICIIDFGMYFPSKVEALQEMAHMTDAIKLLLNFLHLPIIILTKYTRQNGLLYNAGQKLH
jgi:hypothetical protein